MSVVVKTRRTQREHNESAYTPIADIQANIDLRRFGPKPDLDRRHLFRQRMAAASALPCRANARGGAKIVPAGYNDEYEVARRFAGKAITQSEEWYEAVRSRLVCAAEPLVG